jgi:hypothetical protein
MRYRVDVLTADHTEHHARGLTLSQAWRIVLRHARRGARLHGGGVAISNWGARGGEFPRAYRSAVIKLDLGGAL